MATRSIHEDIYRRMIIVVTDWDDDTSTRVEVTYECLESAIGNYPISGASREGDVFTIDMLRQSLGQSRGMGVGLARQNDWSSVLLRAAEPSFEAMREVYGGRMNDDDYANRLRGRPDFGRVNPYADEWDLMPQKIAPATRDGQEPRKRQIKLSREEVEAEETKQLLKEAQEDWSFYDYKKHPIPSAAEVKRFAKQLREFGMDDTCPIDAYLDAVQYVEEAEETLIEMDRTNNAAMRRVHQLEERVKELEAMLSKPKRIVRMR